MAIKVTYRRTRRLSMRVVSNGDLHISAPYGVPKSEIDRFVRDNAAWVREAMQRQLAANQKRLDFYSQLSLKTRNEVQEAVQKLDTFIQPLLQKYSTLMGVRPTRISYKPTISRWGACNKKNGEICFSLYLLLLPDWCVEHVVVHELAHLIEANHSPRFHALMDQFFPRWREARKTTRSLLTTNQ